MLEIKDVRYRYHQAVFQFDASICKGSITAIMGPSGAGKSTLLALVSGFITPECGEISVDGKSVLSLEPYQRPFAMLFQEHNLFGHLTVRENIGLGLHPGLKLSDEQKQQVEQAAQQVGIVEHLERLPEQLSGGQKQRVALARCFVQPHPIWLLDEPFSALDPVLRSEMLNLVKQLAAERDITVLMVTHHLSDTKAIASNFVFVDDYRVQLCEPVDSLSSEHAHSGLRNFVLAAE
ncbi:thiamine ABC transporter ATP-binding protein [Vibrio hannami]|uniref:thiamine ABC transporter ATP-binding protein n=1 Tax=Vibrio hannami TaxID=2717094 RepID=UPI00240F3202|nr:thiamine ABC transporter ATP-binding protein [Vibrio hannami]MDG3087034.1 thiamine ABC transporter ATP-binding protein [Vibrio hannami]